MRAHLQKFFNGIIRMINPRHAFGKCPEPALPLKPMHWKNPAKSTASLFGHPLTGKAALRPGEVLLEHLVCLKQICKPTLVSISETCFPTISCFHCLKTRRPIISFMWFSQSAQKSSKILSDCNHLLPLLAEHAVLLRCGHLCRNI